MDAVGNVLFGGGVLQEARWFLKGFFGQIEGDPVDGDEVGSLKIDERLHRLGRVYVDAFH